jgi:hypothetical protein
MKRLIAVMLTIVFALLPAMSPRQTQAAFCFESAREACYRVGWEWDDTCCTCSDPVAVFYCEIGGGTWDYCTTQCNHP